MEVTGNCAACRANFREIETLKVRMAGARYESWENFFRTVYTKTGGSNIGRMDSCSRVCNTSYCAWGNALRKNEGRWAVRNPDVKGSESYRLAAREQQETRTELEEDLVAATDYRTQGFLAQELKELECRMHMLERFWRRINQRCWSNWSMFCDELRTKGGRAVGRRVVLNESD